MSTFCLLVAIVLFVLVGFKVNPPALKDIDLVGFGLAFFAAAHVSMGDFFGRR